MMQIIRRLERVSFILNGIANAFLCLSGIVLIYWGLFSIDDTVVRYCILFAGGLFFCSGCWFYKFDGQCCKRRQKK
ncbi:MAG TPA: hypothetical protein ENJ30_02320 [Desulfobulbaceae bacterium]|nr:hypothetical protein [Desulfobulbaceae bacterium]